MDVCDSDYLYQYSKCINYDLVLTLVKGKDATGSVCLPYSGKFLYGANIRMILNAPSLYLKTKL